MSLQRLAEYGLAASEAFRFGAASLVEALDEVDRPTPSLGEVGPRRGEVRGGPRAPQQPVVGHVGVEADERRHLGHAAFGDRLELPVGPEDLQDLPARIRPELRDIADELGHPREVDLGGGAAQAGELVGGDRQPQLALDLGEGDPQPPPQLEAVAGGEDRRHLAGGVALVEGVLRCLVGHRPGV